MSKLPHRGKYKVFIAARFAERERAKGVMHLLIRDEAIECVCPWFLSDRDDDTLTSSEKLALSVTSVKAIRDCDYFIHLHHDDPQRGGNLVELGMAIAFGKTIVAVCPTASVLPRGSDPYPPRTLHELWKSSPFHELPQIERCISYVEAVQLIHKWVGRRGDPSPASRGVMTYSVDDEQRERWRKDKGEAPSGVTGLPASPAGVVRTTGDLEIYDPEDPTLRHQPRKNKSGNK